jgi:hypothetical protein
MRIYNEDGTLNDNNWMFVAARWAGSHYKLARRILLLLILIIVGVLLWGITYN